MKKIVLTGAPGSGKSSIIRVLQYDLNERTIAEAAEDIIKILQGQGIEKPWEREDFQDRILELQLQREQQVEELEGRVFIDRGILDGLAYYQLQGKTSSEAMKQAIENTRERYEKIFLIEGGNSCEKNAVRREDLEEAKKLEELQYRNYTEAGYSVERVPYLGIAKRARRILESLTELKGGERK
jgi:predicted ATPase